MGDDYSSRGTIISPELQAHMKAESVHSYAKTVPAIYARVGQEAWRWSCLECRTREAGDRLENSIALLAQAKSEGWREKYLEEIADRIVEEREALATLEETCRSSSPAPRKR